MYKAFSIPSAIILLSVFLLSACGSENSDAETAGAKSTADKTQEKTVQTSKAAKKNEIPTDGVMAEAVNFSTPQDIQNSFQAIEDEAGEFVVGQLKNAIDYMLVYDLSVSRNKQKLYEKLNGKTPTEILSMAK